MTMHVRTPFMRTSILDRIQGIDHSPGFAVVAAGFVVVVVAEGLVLAAGLVVAARKAIIDASI